MSFLRRGTEHRAAAGTFTQTHNPLNTLYAQYGLMSAAGERVDEITALGVSAVFAAVSLLADSVAVMPLKATRTRRDGSEEPANVPVWLSNPDPVESNRYEFIHQAMISLALHGNFYGLVARSSNVPGGIAGVTPLHPYQMNVLSNATGTGRRYLHLGKEIPTEDMLHIRAFCPPQSLVGVSPLLQQRTTIGIAISMDRFLAQWYAEGGTPSSVLETDRPVTAEQARVLRETWEGSQRKHRRPAILSDGLKWRPVSVSAVDMEYTASREQVIADVARAFRIPPHLLNAHTQSSDYANVEQSGINYLTYTLQPWISRLEIAFSTLLPPSLNVHFDPSVLLRLDARTAAEVDRIRISSGTRNPNEVRLRDGLEPYKGGDQFIFALGKATGPGANVKDATQESPTTATPDGAAPAPAPTDGVDG